MITLILIANDPDLARVAVQAGVGRIMVDLEILGKRERQGHRDTLISGHRMEDIPPIRTAIGGAELMVRLNPLHDGTSREIEDATSMGADLLMLPMYRRTDEVRHFVELVNGRAGVVPLAETRNAVDSVQETVGMQGLHEIYLGLNDLHLEMKTRFMFTPLATGIVDRFCQTASDAGLRFGFGGIARMNEGELPGRLVLAEHVRLGTHSVILSRTFHRRSRDLESARAKLDFAEEIANLRAEEAKLRLRSEADVEHDRVAAAACIREIENR